MVFFGSIAVASFTGGTVHGFFAHESTLGYRILWPITLLAIGVTAAAAWVLAGMLTNHFDKLRIWCVLALCTFLTYAALVLFYSQSYTLVVLNYLPAMIALMFATTRRFVQTRLRCFLWIGAGIMASFVAALFQQAGVGIHRQYFNHNATYHVIQACGLFLMFQGSHQLLNAREFQC